MIGLFFLSCTRSVPMNEQSYFSPALPGVVQKLTWRYTSDCKGIEARWDTKLPVDAKVQVMVGPKTKNPHFDDDAVATYDTIVNSNKQVFLNIEDLSLPKQETFINLRVWGNTPSTYNMLIQSQKKGGFPVAESPEGPYGWAETTIPVCTK